MANSNREENDTTVAEGIATKSNDLKTQGDPIAPFSDEVLNCFKQKILKKIEKEKEVYDALKFDFEDCDDMLLRMSKRTDMERQFNFIESLRLAIFRIDVKTFGISYQTGEPIPYKKLNAMPWVTC